MASRRDAAATAATALAMAIMLATASTTLSSATAMPATPRRALWGKDMPVNPFCPWDAVKFGACAGVLGVVSAHAGASLGSKCCALVDGLAAAEAAACLCTTIKETVLGIPTQWTVGVSVLASTCKTELPDGFKCV
uniref:Bifunctional inhibitor/plant lipid transfer protein/seed storage helical domain-containing protein n=1 Tax=Leersia perrieri TaxID=77586 RepID=A0A0D9WA98_9ORYZ